MAFPGFHPVVQKRLFRSGRPADDRAVARMGGDRRRTRYARRAPTGTRDDARGLLTALNWLLEESHAAPVPDEARAVQVSPLKPACRWG